MREERTGKASRNPSTLTSNSNILNLKPKMASWGTGCRPEGELSGSGVRFGVLGVCSGWGAGCRVQGVLGGWGGGCI